MCVVELPLDHLFSCQSCDSGTFPPIADCRHLMLNCMGWRAPQQGNEHSASRIQCWFSLICLGFALLLWLTCPQWIHITSCPTVKGHQFPNCCDTQTCRLCHIHLENCSFQRSDKIFCMERGKLAQCLSNTASATASQFTSITWKPHSNLSPLSCEGKVCPTFSYLVTCSQKREVIELTWKEPRLFFCVCREKPPPL